MEKILNILFSTVVVIVLVLFGAIIYYMVRKENATRPWITNGFFLGVVLLIITWLLSIVNGLL